MEARRIGVKAASKYFSLFLDRLADFVVIVTEKTFSKIICLDPDYIRELTRYFVVGVLVSLGSALTIVAIVEYFAIVTPVIANIISFVLWTPASYVGHKDFTFEYSGAMQMTAVKFFVVFGAKLLVSILAIMLFQYFGYSYIFGVISNWVLVPVATFIVLKLWVFD